MALPDVLLLGRTNVGKSSLFNRLTGGRFAIADAQPHTTRDLQRRAVHWNNSGFTLVDSGGFDIDSPDELHANVLRMVRRTLATAAAVVMVVEHPIGLRQEERRELTRLQAAGVPVIIAVNKLDAPDARGRSVSLSAYAHGTVPVIGVSAKNGGGTGDLLDAIARAVGTRSADRTTPRTLRVVLIGRTNVGKSALTNAMLHDDARVVSSQPHTTRDAAAFTCTYHGTKLTIVDTAGVRARGKTGSRVEALSLRHTRDALRDADIAVLVYSVPDGVGVVEKALAGDVVERGTGLLVVGNQWDRIPGKTPTSSIAAERELRRSLPFISWAPHIVTSATEGVHVHRILQTTIAIGEERIRTIPQETLDRVQRQALTLKPGEKLGPRSKHGGRKRVTSILTQTGTRPPSFTLRTDKREALPASYARVVEKALRTAVPFTGTPIRVSIQQPFAKSL